MSKPKVFEKPTGVKDYLPEAVAKLRRIENQVLECMQRWGYRQIVTPTLEFYDTVGVASSTSDRKLFKLLDKRGTTLVMRSDMTAPIARVVSSLLREEPFPLRLSYHSSVFRAIEEEVGREAEFFQTGVELVGDASPEADAEVVALAIASLKAAGIANFRIALGHVGFLNGLFRETLMNRPNDQLSLKECLLNRDHVGYRKCLTDLTLPDKVREELAGILRLRGGQEICKQAQMLTEDPTAQAAMEHLCEIWDVLTAYGVSEYVLIDLTMIGNFSYYTGMTFEGYSSDLGFPVCSGGRYDNLLQQFGRSAPATGFALETNRILQMVHSLSGEEPYKVLITYDAGQREEALCTAQELRSRDGYMVETRKTADGKDAKQITIEDNGNGTYLYNGICYDDIIEFSEQKSMAEKKGE